MRYILIVMLTFMFVGCFSYDDETTSSESVDDVSVDISKTQSLQPIVEEELQPPRPPAL